MSSQMYRELILEHYKHPQNYGVLNPCDVTYTKSNPLCGDEITVYLRIEDSRIQGIHFTGKGCAISIASASLFSEKVKGLLIEEVLALDENAVVEELCMDVNPARMKCATLILSAIKQAVIKQ